MTKLDTIKKSNIHRNGLSAAKDIKIAESETKKGIEKYNELMALFRKEYAHEPLAIN